MIYFLDDPERVARMVEKESAHAVSGVGLAAADQIASAVDRLNHGPDAMFSQAARCISQVFDKDLLGFRAVGAFRQNPGDRVHGVAAERLTIGYCRIELASKFLLPPRHRGEATFSRSPIARLRIDQHHGEIVAAK